VAGSVRTVHFPLRLWRAFASRPRLIVGIGAGVVPAFTLPRDMEGAARAIVSWDIGVLAYLCLSAMLFTAERADRMEADAEAQQEGEWTIFALTLAAVSFSFFAIIDAFSGIKDMDPTQKSLHVVMVVVTLLLSWLMTHTTFAFRYAHEYYAHDLGGPEIDRGLEFPGTQQPDYLDFMYFSLVIGMTFQVSDVQITARKLRRVATLHGLLSFLFNTIILALTVNLGAGLL
jgi:uncharacterized membrane protein